MRLRLCRRRHDYDTIPWTSQRRKQVVLGLSLPTDVRSMVFARAVVYAIRREDRTTRKSMARVKIKEIWEPIFSRDHLFYAVQHSSSAAVIIIVSSIGVRKSNEGLYHCFQLRNDHLDYPDRPSVLDHLDYS